MSIPMRLAVIAFLFVLTVGSGIWLSHHGRPLSNMLFTIHKLVALITVVFTGLSIQRLLRDVEVNPGMLGLIVVSGCFIIVLFVSGALLSTGKSTSELMKSLHNVATMVTVITLAIVFYFLAGRD